MKKIINTDGSIILEGSVEEILEYERNQVGIKSYNAYPLCRPEKYQLVGKAHLMPNGNLRKDYEPNIVKDYKPNMVTTIATGVRDYAGPQGLEMDSNGNFYWAGTNKA
jgi:hypothetical protein